MRACSQRKYSLCLLLKESNSHESLLQRKYARCLCVRVLFRDFEQMRIFTLVLLLTLLLVTTCLLLLFIFYLFSLTLHGPHAQQNAKQQETRLFLCCFLFV